METLKEKLKAYERQKEQAYQIYLKSIGAIEAIQALIEEDDKSGKKKK